jgi:hypothetical protein
MPDGAVRQAFAAGVLERPSSSDLARLAPVGQLAVDTGMVTPPASAVTPAVPPALPPADDDRRGPDEPTSVEPFVVSLLIGLALYVGLPTIAYEVAVMSRRRRSTDRAAS